MIKVICDICGKEAKGNDFVFEAVKLEILLDIASGQKRKEEHKYQICKDCYIKHISKLWKNIK